MATQTIAPPADAGRSPDAVGLTGPTVRICLILAAAVIFNVYPHKVGVYTTWGDSAPFYPILAPCFASVMPVLNLWWGLAFSLEVLLLVLGRWTAGTHLARFALDVWMVVILADLAKGEHFLHVPVATVAVQVGLVVAALVTGLGALGRLTALIRSHPWRT